MISKKSTRAPATASLSDIYAWGVEKWTQEHSSD